MTPRTRGTAGWVAAVKWWQLCLAVALAAIVGCGEPVAASVGADRRRRSDRSADDRFGVARAGPRARQGDGVRRGAGVASAPGRDRSGSGRRRVFTGCDRGTHLGQGEVDLYLDSPFPVSWVVHETGARPLLRRLKQGEASYRSVLFARRDSGLQSIEDLRGHVIAFGEPFSTSSFLLPKASLVERGLQLERYEDPAADVPDDVIGYVFSNDWRTR